MKVKEERKNCLKTQHSENEDHGIWSHHFMGNSWGNSGKSAWLYHLYFKITVVGDCSHGIERYLHRNCCQTWPWLIKGWTYKLLAYEKVVKVLVTQLYLILYYPMNCSTPGLPVHHPESTQTHVHWVGDAIQPSYSLSSPSPPVFNLSQHQVLFKWVSSSHQVAKVLEFQLQHQSYQWTPRTDLL